MVKRVLCLAVTILICSGLFAGPAGATKARDMGLGLYEHPWMMDGLQTRIYKNPAYLSMFNSRVFFVRTDDNLGGLFFSPVKNLNLGVFTGVALDDDTWNTTGPTGFYNTGGGKYVIKANQYKPFTSANPSTATVDLLEPDGNSDTSSTAPDYREKLDKQDVSLTGSYTLGKMAFGLNVGYGSSWSDDSYELKQPILLKDEYSFWSTQLDAILGWLFAFSEDMVVDIAAGYSLYQLENKYIASIPGIETELKYETDGAMDITGIIGFHWELSKMYKLHINAGYGMLNHSTKGAGKHTNSGDVTENIDAVEKYDRKGQTFSFGASTEISILDIAKGYVGFDGKMTMFSYDYSGADKENSSTDAEIYKSKTRIIEAPLVMGIEGNLSENWTGRFSLSHNLFDPTYKTEDRTYIIASVENEVSYADDSDSASDTELNIGLSYRLGNFVFDWLMNVDIFKEGPYIISGKFDPSNPGEASTPISMAFAATFLFDSGEKGSLKDKKSILQN